MKHEVETDRHSNPQDTLDAEEVPSCNGANETDETECTELEERVRADCRRSCRRNFWIELFKSAAKIAGVVLAALGLSVVQRGELACWCCTAATRGPTRTSPSRS